MASQQWPKLVAKRTTPHHLRTTMHLGLFASSLLLTVCFGSISNKVDPNRHLIVLAPPSVHDEYYKSNFAKMVPFYINYANKILGHDNVVLIADKDTMPNFVDKLPEDILLQDTIADCWIRDPSPAMPSKSVQFKYVGGLKESEAAEIQKTYNTFARNYNVQKKMTTNKLDAGNVVDNNRDKAVVSTKYLEDNNLEYEDGKNRLKASLGLKQLALVEGDEPKLAHADGMVTWLTANTLAVNEYDEPFRSEVLEELNHSLPDTEIVEVPNYPSLSTFKGGFASSCGMYVNSVVTEQYIYMPTFKNGTTDKKAFEAFNKYTDKQIIQVDATPVCDMGGSLRCLSWQAQGSNAEHLIEAARGTDDYYYYDY